MRVKSFTLAVLLLTSYCLANAESSDGPQEVKSDFNAALDNYGPLRIEVSDDITKKNEFDILEEFFTSRNIDFADPENNFKVADKLITEKTNQLKEKNHYVPLRLRKEQLALSELNDVIKGSGRFCQSNLIDNISNLQKQITHAQLDDDKIVSRIAKHYLKVALKSCYQTPAFRTSLLKEAQDTRTGMRSNIELIPIETLRQHLPNIKLSIDNEPPLPDQQVSIEFWARMLRLISWPNKGRCTEALFYEGEKNYQKDVIREIYSSILSKNLRQCRSEPWKNKLDKLEWVGRAIKQHLPHEYDFEQDAPIKFINLVGWFLIRRYRRFLCSQLKAIDDDSMSVIKRTIELEMSEEDPYKPKPLEEKGAGLVNVSMERLLGDYAAIPDDIVYNRKYLTAAEILEQFFERRNIDLDDPINNLMLAERLVEKQAKRFQLEKWSCRLRAEMSEIQYLKGLLKLATGKRSGQCSLHIMLKLNYLKGQNIYSDDKVVGKILKLIFSKLVKSCLTELKNYVQGEINSEPTIPIELVPIDEFKKQLPASAQDNNNKLGSELYFFGGPHTQELVKYLISFDKGFVWPPPDEQVTASRAQQHPRAGAASSRRLDEEIIKPKRKAYNWFCGFNTGNESLCSKRPESPTKINPTVAKYLAIVKRLKQHCKDYNVKHILLPKLEDISQLIKKYLPEEFDNELGVPKIFGTDLKWLEDLKFRKSLCHNIATISTITPIESRQTSLSSKP